MSPSELWWYVEAKLPPRMYGSMTEEQVAALYEEMKDAGFEAEMQRTGEQVRFH
jgi:hypothetical protein